MRCHLQCRVDSKAAFALLVTHGDLIEECLDGFARRQFSFEASLPLVEAALNLVVKRPPEQRAFVTEGLVQTRPGNSHLFREVAQRSRFVAARPKTLNCGVKPYGFLKFSRSCHSVRVVLQSLFAA